MPNSLKSGQREDGNGDIKSGVRWAAKIATEDPTSLQWAPLWLPQPVHRGSVIYYRICSLQQIRANQFLKRNTILSPTGCFLRVLIRGTSDMDKVLQTPPRDTQWVSPIAASLRAREANANTTLSKSRSVRSQSNKVLIYSVLGLSLASIWKESEACQHSLPRSQDSHITFQEWPVFLRCDLASESFPARISR